MAKLSSITDDVLNVIDSIKNSIAKNNSDDSLLPIRLDAYFSWKKSCCDECHFVDVDIENEYGYPPFHAKGNLLIQDTLYYFRNDTVLSRKFNPFKMRIRFNYFNPPKNAAPELVGIWYRYLDEMGYFNSFKYFLENIYLTKYVD